MNGTTAIEVNSKTNGKTE